MSAAPGRSVSLFLAARPGAPQDGVLEEIDPAEFHDTAGRYVVCQTCKVPLNKLTYHAEDSVQWLHTRNWQQYDHEPVPVVTDRDENQAACDFCGVIGRLSWAYTGDRITIPGINRTTSDFGTVWGACAACDALISSGNMSGLLARAKRVSPAVAGYSKWEIEQSAIGWMVLWERFLPTVHNRSYVGPRREPAKLSARMMPKLRNGLLKFWGQPSDPIRHPKERGSAVPVPGVHAGDEDTFVVRYSYGETIPEHVWQNHTDHLRAGIGVAEMFWVSEQFTTLAIAAGKDFTEEPILELDSLPAKFGFMVFETPIGEIQRNHGVADLRGLSWTIVPHGIWLNLYIQGEDSDPYIDVEQMRAEIGYLACPNAGSGLVLGKPIPVGDDPRYQFMRTILATFFLMKQPGVAEQTVAPVDRRYARAFKREYGPARAPEPVRLVNLRHVAGNRSGGASGGRPREFRHFVRGHWKRQPYGPKRGLRREIYVSPYVTGTEDMPFRAPQEKVYLVK